MTLVFGPSESKNTVKRKYYFVDPAAASVVSRVTAITDIKPLLQKTVTYVSVYRANARK